MRRQEGPLEKQANLVKMANCSKSSTTWRPMQVSRRGLPCKAGECGENDKLVKIVDNWEVNANEQTRGPLCKAGEFGESGENCKISPTTT